MLSTLGLWPQGSYAPREAKGDMVGKYLSQLPLSSPLVGFYHSLCTSKSVWDKSWFYSISTRTITNSTVQNLPSSNFMIFKEKQSKLHDSFFWEASCKWQVWSTSSTLQGRLWKLFARWWWCSLQVARTYTSDLQSFDIKRLVIAFVFLLRKTHLISQITFIFYGGLSCIICTSSWLFPKSTTFINKHWRLKSRKWKWSSQKMIILQKM
jgi:hypothetical protein